MIGACQLTGKIIGNNREKLKNNREYAQALLAATPQSQLAQSDKPKAIEGLTVEQMALMERESVNLDREF
jgi:hypothetical protein